jgi:hypothetical protein
MKIDTVDERAKWESVLGLSDRISVRAPDSLFYKLTAEENLFREVEVVGLLRNTRTLDIGNVTVLGPSIAKQAYLAGEETRAAADRAEIAARRAELAAEQAEMFAEQTEHTARRVEAIEERLEDQFLTREYQSMANWRRALRMRYARQHGEF